MYDLSLHQLLIRLGACVIIVAIHGFSLAVIARIMGDRGPKFDDRFTPNPISHLDLVGAAAMILFQLGWIRPIAIDLTQLRFGRLGLLVCVWASLGATLFATMLLLGLRIPMLSLMPSAVAPTTIAILNEAVEISTWFVAFNLFPLPPLTGEHFLVAIWPNFAKPLRDYRTYAGVLLAVLVLGGLVQPVVRPLRDIVSSLVSGL
jgi:Zn-dependent protease